MRILREGTQCEPSGRGLSENPQGREPQWEPSGRGLSEIPQGGDSVRNQGTQ